MNMPTYPGFQIFQKSGNREER